MNLFKVYSLWPIEPVKGLGCRLWDSAGVEYLDFYGGHAVISVGHSHPAYVQSITDQIAKLGFYSNSVVNGVQSSLAQKLGEISGYPDYSLFLCNSGAEANENALKLASFHTGKERILAFTHSFHGRTSGAVAATDNPKLRSPFNSSANVTFVPLNDVEAVERELSSGDYAAVIIEGIQGVAGIFEPEPSFWTSLRSLCSRYEVVLIADEVQSGYGRSGDFFAHSKWGIKADIITTAKGMGNGFPIAGVIISPQFKGSPGLLGTTFGGNHLGCAAAMSVLDIIKDENLVENSKLIGDYIIKELSGVSAIKEIRGRGLILGIELKEGYSKLRDALLFENHIFTGAAGASVIRVLPPMNITKGDADIFIEAFKNQVKKIENE